MDELLNYLRDIGASVLKHFKSATETQEKNHKELVETIADEAITTRNLIKSLADDEQKPEKEQIDFTPVLKSNEAEGNFTRKTIEAQTDEVKKLTKVTETSSQEVIKTSKSLLQAIKEFDITIPPFPEIKLPTIDLSSITGAMSKTFDLLKEGFNKLLKRGSKDDPLYVKYLDRDGNEIDPTRPTIIGGTGASSSTATYENQIQQIQATNKTFALRLVQVGVYTYVGKANVGTSDSAKAWQIKRLDQTSGLSITWANGKDTFTNAWTDYLIINYI